MSHKKSTQQHARNYIRKRGWCVVPIPRGKKRRAFPNGQDLRIKESEVEDYFDDDSNIGVLLGEPSDNLIDIDLDCEEAIFLAPFFLPSTGRVHGRKTKRASHYWYHAERSPEPKKFSDADGTCLVELRSTGQQTVIAPSIHPSREQIRWEKKEKSGRVKAADLQKDVSRLAGATVLARHWATKGGRNEAALALAGMLERAGWDEIAIGEFVGQVARAGDDDEWLARKAAARSTRKRLESGGQATGRPRLAKLLGANVR